MQQEKKLTAVIAALDTFAEVKVLLTWLDSQTVRDQVEIMLVCQDLATFNLPPQTEAPERSAPLRIVECGRGKTLAEARAIGCRAAETPYVGFFEDHAFPEPRWCERVLARIEEGWSGVGGAFLSANPQTMLARGQILVGYGQWMHPVPAGEMAFISGHGSVYDRGMLMSCDDDLEDLLIAEALMMMELGRQGHRFFCESEVVTWHFDASCLQDSLQMLSYPPVSHSLAAQRSRSWPAWRRFLYGLAFPVIGLVRWKRAAVAFARTRSHTGFPASSLLAAGFVALLWSVNECRGFWFGFGDSLQELSDFEHNRTRHLNEGEWPHPHRPRGMSQEEFRQRTAAGLDEA